MAALSRARNVGSVSGSLGNDANGEGARAIDGGNPCLHPPHHCRRRRQQAAKATETAAPPNHRRRAAPSRPAPPATPAKSAPPPPTAGQPRRRLPTSQDELMRCSRSSMDRPNAAPKPRPLAGSLADRRARPDRGDGGTDAVARTGAELPHHRRRIRRRVRRPDPSRPTRSRTDFERDHRAVDTLSTRLRIP